MAKVLEQIGLDRGGGGFGPEIAPLQGVVPEIVEFAFGAVIQGRRIITGDDPTIAVKGAQTDGEVAKLRIPFRKYSGAVGAFPGIAR